MRLIRLVGQSRIVGAVFAASLSLLVSCGKSVLTGGPIDGMVLDALTLQPVPDAMVLVKWRGIAQTVHSNSVPCYHIELATTDANGRYHIKPWRLETKGHADWIAHINQTGPIEPVVYKRGYVMPLRYQEDPSRVLVESFRGTGLERLGYLVGKFYQYETACDADGKTQIPVYEAAYEEAKAFANGVEEMKWLDTLLTEIETAKFGNDVALDRKNQRRLQDGKGQKDRAHK